jgi:hypothetical protein
MVAMKIKTTDSGRKQDACAGLAGHSGGSFMANPL